MTAVKKWVAAGSSAAVLAGGLFLGTPAAYADTCTAPGAGTTVSNLITAADELHDTGVHFNSLVADEGVLAQLQAQQAVLEDAIVNDSTLDRAQGAWTAIADLQQSYAESTDDPAVDDAYAASAAAAAHFQAVALDARAEGLVFMENGADLVALFEASCGGLAPAGTVDSGEDDGSGTDTGTNTGLNVDTAQAEETDAAPLAALLAAGAAASAAVALRMRRRARV
ncbi:hypothetical protein [Kocuria rosea]|uniref:hypothetical protein n=1 Tax=Kocuria rosea TaxID=1275 RepID=UPI00203F63AE|nr:hypothetical protein [Kocuria rosea]MCM3687700.1 hypothetical protein [Kocuria rosea]